MRINECREILTKNIEIVGSKARVYASNVLVSIFEGSTQIDISADSIISIKIHEIKGFRLCFIECSENNIVIARDYINIFSKTTSN